MAIFSYNIIFFRQREIVFSYTNSQLNGIVIPISARENCLHWFSVVYSANNKTQHLGSVFDVICHYI